MKTVTYAADAEYLYEQTAEDGQELRYRRTPWTAEIERWWESSGPPVLPEAWETCAEPRGTKIRSSDIFRRLLREESVKGVVLLLAVLLGGGCGASSFVEGEVNGYGIDVQSAGFKLVEAQPSSFIQVYLSSSPDVCSDIMTNAHRQNERTLIIGLSYADAEKRTAVEGRAVIMVFNENCVFDGDRIPPDRREGEARVTIDEIRLDDGGRLAGSFVATMGINEAPRQMLSGEFEAVGPCREPEAVVEPTCR